MKPLRNQEIFEQGFWLLFGKQADAGEEYLRIWRALVSFFKGLSDPEELADEVLDRMIRKAAQERIEIHEKLHYALTVAKYVRLEYRKKTPVLTSYDGIQFELRDPVDTSDRETRLQILDECLEELPPHQRDLILTYYEWDKVDKIEQREKLAAELGISTASLRVRVHRIRSVLENKFDRKWSAHR